jgi:hypothetical protein
VGLFKSYEYNYFLRPLKIGFDHTNKKANRICSPKHLEHHCPKQVASTLMEAAGVMSRACPGPRSDDRG